MVGMMLYAGCGREAVFRGSLGLKCEADEKKDKRHQEIWRMVLARVQAPFFAKTENLLFFCSFSIQPGITGQLP